MRNVPLLAIVYMLMLTVSARWPRRGHSPPFAPMLLYQRPLDAMVDITNELGVAVLQDQAFTKGNFAFSPYGVASVLVVLYEGAQGESARQIHNTMRLPWNRDVTRIGFRDIHRHLRSYFTHEGYLSGMSLNKNPASLRPEYRHILRFYGYDIDLAMGPMPSTIIDTTTEGMTTDYPDTTSSPQTDITDTTTDITETTTDDLTETTIELTGTPIELTEITTEFTASTIELTETPTDTTQISIQLTVSPTELTKTTTETSIELTEVPLEPPGTPTDLTQTPTELTETPTELTKTTTESPIELTEVPLEPPGTPTDITQVPIQLTETPTELTKTTTESIETPIEVPGTPTELTKTTTQATEYSTDITETSTHLTKTSTDLTETSTHLTKTSTDLTDTPIDFTETPTPLTGILISIMENTVEIITELTEPPTDLIETSTNLLTDITIAPTDLTGTSTHATEPSTDIYEMTTGVMESSTDVELDLLSTPEDLIKTSILTTDTSQVITSTVISDIEEQNHKEEFVNDPEIQVRNVDDNFEKVDLLTVTNHNNNARKAKSQELLLLKRKDPNVPGGMTEDTVALPLTTGNASPTYQGTSKNHLAQELNLHDLYSQKERNEETEDESEADSHIKRLLLEPSSLDESIEYPDFSKMNWRKRSVSQRLTASDTTTRGAKGSRMARAIRSGSIYPDMSLQLHNGMYDSHVSRGHAIYTQLPRYPFLVDGTTEELVPVMTYTTVFPFAYIRKLHTLALQFPLDDERYRLLLLLPVERRGLHQLIYGLQSYSLRDVCDALKPTRVNAIIPSFMVEGFVILTPTLQQLGIWDVFDPRRANLTTMSKDPDLYVRNIEQSITVVIRNYVEIFDIQTRTMAARGMTERFLATHPFLYFVMDTETKVSLMAGKIVDPLNSRIY